MSFLIPFYNKYYEWLIMWVFTFSKFRQIILVSLLRNKSFSCFAPGSLTQLCEHTHMHVPVAMYSFSWHINKQENIGNSSLCFPDRGSWCSLAVSTLSPRMSCTSKLMWTSQSKTHIFFSAKRNLFAKMKILSQAKELWWTPHPNEIKNNPLSIHRSRHLGQNLQFFFSDSLGI